MKKPDAGHHQHGLEVTLRTKDGMMLGFIKIVAPPYILINTPTGLHGLTLAMFLIAKGYNPSKAE